MARCITCGTDQNRTGARFCARCGARLSFLAPGDVLQGRYKIIRVLGKGGMGAVCLAEDARAHDKRCVVKEMIDYFNPSDPNEVQKAQRRFEDETRILAQLNHNSIPELLETFTEAGRNYMVMTYVEGENLEEALRRNGKPLAADEVIPYAIQICGVLEYLASRQPPVIHHDIKPSNIIINREAHTLKLVDFGTAKMRPVQAGGQLGQGQSSVYGTLGYAPPEQYGEAPRTEPRSDVYALGATLYHLLTGDDPGNHPMDFPQLKTLPSSLRSLLEWALDPNVNNRITAAEMRKELEHMLAAGVTTQPFVFPSGERAHSVEELARLCDLHWEDGRQLLREGAFSAWLRSSLFRGDLAREADSLRGQQDPDQALEQFIRALDPNLPPPRPTVGLPKVDFGRIRPAQRAQRDIPVRNRAGRGHLFGTVAVDPPAPWLAVAPTTFSGNQATLRLTVDTRGQRQGALLSTQLMIHSPFGAVERVPVHVRVAFDWPAFLRSTFWLTALGLILAGGAGRLMTQAALAGVSGESWVALFGVGALTALVIGLVMGSALGGPDRYSLSGCLLWLILAIPLLAYLFLAMRIQLWSLGRAGMADWLPLVTAIVGGLLFLLLGLFRGLSKAGRAWLRWLVPLVISVVLVAWAQQTTFLRVEFIPFHWEEAERMLREMADLIPPGRLAVVRMWLMTARVEFSLPLLVTDWRLLSFIDAAWKSIQALLWPGRGT